MTDKKPVKRNDVTSRRTPATESTYVPDVDIHESADSITLIADMPGADQSSVDVTVENSVLRIAGCAGVDAPEGYELIGQEYGVGKFRREFTLSDRLDTAGIRARVRHGALELTIPRREEAKTRKIEVAS